MFFQSEDFSPKVPMFRQAYPQAKLLKRDLAVRDFEQI